MWLAPVGACLISLDVHTLATLRILVNLPLEPSLDGFEDLLIPLGRYQRDCHTFRSEASSTTDTVQIGVSRLGKRVFVARTWVLWRIGHVVVDGDIDALNVDTTAEDVGADADTVDEVLEVGVAFDTVRFGLVDSSDN